MRRPLVLLTLCAWLGGAATAAAAPPRFEPFTGPGPRWTLDLLQWLELFGDRIRTVFDKPGSQWDPNGQSSGGSGSGSGSGTDSDDSDPGTTDPGGNDDSTVGTTTP